MASHLWHFSTIQPNPSHFSTIQANPSYFSTTQPNPSHFSTIQPIPDPEELQKCDAMLIVVMMTLVCLVLFVFFLILIYICFTKGWVYKFCSDSKWPKNGLISPYKSSKSQHSIFLSLYKHYTNANRLIIDLIFETWLLKLDLLKLDCWNLHWLNWNLHWLNWKLHWIINLIFFVIAYFHADMTRKGTHKSRLMSLQIHVCVIIWKRSM